MMRRRLSLEAITLIPITVAGLGIFIGPLLMGVRFPQGTSLFTALIACASLVVIALALQTHRLSTRLLAVLAALVAIDATIRLIIVVGLLGFSPIFFLIIIGGFVMGPGFGFALGALTLLLSAVLTAGFGPWLPYQMLGAAWVGMGAGYLRKGNSLIGLALYGCLAGFAYGVLLDLWEWPFLLGPSSPISWAPGLASGELIRRFLTFYGSTSFLYDAFRAAGNVVLILLIGKPIILALTRFRRRFLVEWVTNIAGDVRTPA
jgi:energy-coupling factor transport system substrate-specific component